MASSHEIISAKDPRIQWVLKKIENINKGKTPTKYDICCKHRCKNFAHEFSVCPGHKTIIAVCIGHNPYFMPFDDLTETQKAEFDANGTILCCRQRPKNPCRNLVPISRFGEIGEIINKPICYFHLDTITIPDNQTKTVLIQMPEGRELESAEDQTKQTQPEKTILIQMPEPVFTACGQRNKSGEIQPESQRQPQVAIQGKIPNIFEKYTIIAQTPDGKPCGCKRMEGGETNVTTGFKLCKHHRATYHNFKCRSCDNASVARSKNGNIYFLPFCGERCMFNQVFTCVYGHVNCKVRNHEKVYKCANCSNTRFLNCDLSIVPILETHCRTCHTSQPSSS
jgi:hypothetical protein